MAMTALVLPVVLLFQEYRDWRRRALKAETVVSSRLSALARVKTQPPAIPRQSGSTLPSVRRLATPLEPWTPPSEDDTEER